MEPPRGPDIKKDSLQPPWGFRSLITISKSPTKEKPKDRHLHCGLSQHLLSPQEMLAGAYLGHRVLLSQLFGLKKKTCLTGDGRDERNKNESRTGGLGFRMRPKNPQKTLCSLPRGGESLLRKKKQAGGGPWACVLWSG